VSCGLRDVLELELLARPAVLVTTAAFMDAADEQSVLLGQPALRRHHLAHPIQNRTDDEMRALARGAVDALWAAIS
jgi:hypothetical protein